MSRCCICYEDFTDDSIFVNVHEQYEHVFHAVCLYRYLTAGRPGSDNCPLCQQRIEKSISDRIEDHWMEAICQYTLKEDLVRLDECELRNCACLVDISRQKQVEEVLEKVTNPAMLTFWATKAKLRMDRMLLAKLFVAYYTKQNIQCIEALIDSFDYAAGMGAFEAALQSKAHVIAHLILVRECPPDSPQSDREFAKKIKETQCFSSLSIDCDIAKILLSGNHIEFLEMVRKSGFAAFQALLKAIVDVLLQENPADKWAYLEYIIALEGIKIDAYWDPIFGQAARKGKLVALQGLLEKKLVKLGEVVVYIGQAIVRKQKNVLSIVLAKPKFTFEETLDILNLLRDNNFVHLGIRVLQCVAKKTPNKALVLAGTCGYLRFLKPHLEKPKRMVRMAVLAACEQGHLDIVKSAAGPHVDLLADGMMLAVENYKQNIVDHLISLNVDYTAALKIACRKKDGGLAEWLVRRIPDRAAANEALLLAAKYDLRPLMTYIRRKYNPDLSTNKYQALRTAGMRGSLIVLKSLLDSAKVIPWKCHGLISRILCTWPSAPLNLFANHPRVTRSRAVSNSLHVIRTREIMGVMGKLQSETLAKLLAKYREKKELGIKLVTKLWTAGMKTDARSFYHRYRSHFNLTPEDVPFTISPKATKSSSLSTYKKITSSK